MTRESLPGSLVSVELTCPLRPRYNLSTHTSIKRCRHFYSRSLKFQGRKSRLTPKKSSNHPPPPTATTTQVPTLLPSWFSALSRGGLSGQRGTSLIGRSLVSGAGPGVSWSPPSPSLQEEPTMHSVLSEPQDPNGLEKAAVNHSDQVEGAQCSNGNDIKTETLEDD